MKNLPVILTLFFVALTGTALSAELPVWWKQLSDEAQRDSYSLVTLDNLENLYELKENFLIIDVRAGYEYNEGHLPGAVSFEFDLGDKLQLKPGKREAFLKLLGPDKNRKIIIYCRSFR